MQREKVETLASISYRYIGNPSVGTQSDISICPEMPRCMNTHVGDHERSDGIHFELLHYVSPREVIGQLSLVEDTSVIDEEVQSIVANDSRNLKWINNGAESENPGDFSVTNEQENISTERDKVNNSSKEGDEKECPPVSRDIPNKLTSQEYSKISNELTTKE